MSGLTITIAGIRYLMTTSGLNIHYDSINDAKKVYDETLGNIIKNRVENDPTTEIMIFDSGVNDWVIFIGSALQMKMQDRVAFALKITIPEKPNDKPVEPITTTYISPLAIIYTLTSGNITMTYNKITLEYTQFRILW